MLKFVVLLGVVIQTLAQYNESDEKVAFLFPSLPIGDIASDNFVCNEESALFQRHLENSSLWAYEMWDSTAKQTEGFLRGSLYQLGDFEECLTADAPFPTQYCLVTITAHVPDRWGAEDPYSLTHDPYESVLEVLHKNKDESQLKRHKLHAGWCVPASCTPKDLEGTLNNYLEVLQHPFVDENVSYVAEIQPHKCQTNEEIRRIDGTDISFCLLSFLLLACVSGASFFDILYKSQTKRSKLQKLFLAFSARKNFSDLSKADEGNKALSILYGIRTFSMFVIIIDHRFSLHLSGQVMNFDAVEKEYRSSIAWLIFKADLFVDSFFTFSGLLVTYVLLSQLEKDYMNPGFVLLLRYIRLTPVYAFVIFYYATLLEHAGSGPLWTTVVVPEVKDCQDNWYLNMLYLNNYIRDDHLCMLQTWYMPCEFHFFVVGLCLCYLITKNKKIGIGALLGMTIVSIILPFVITLVNERPGLMHWYPELLVNIKAHPEFRILYSKSHLRATPYFIGMFAGYIYFKARKLEKGVILSRVKSYGITIGSLLLLLLSLYSARVFYNPYHQYNALESSSYAALHRAVWSVGTIGLLFTTSYSKTSFLRPVLSWSPWIPLSKLTYCAYLTHLAFQLRSIGSTPAPRIFNYFDVFSLGISDLVLAFASALILHLCIEAPLRGVFKELLRKSPKSDEVDSPTTVNMSEVVEGSTKL